MAPTKGNERAILVTLVLFGFSACISALALIIFLLYLVGEPSVRATFPSPDIVPSLAVIDGIDQLRQMCVSIARSLEIANSTSEAQSRFINKASGWLLAFLFLWGSLSATGMLYVYAKLRRAEMTLRSNFAIDRDAGKRCALPGARHLGR
jgi:hypothetical protein